MINTNANMENEIELTEELRNYACKAHQQHITILIKVENEWHMGHACITDKLVQFNFESNGRHHYFTPDAFQQFLVRIPSHDSIQNTVYSIQSEKKHGRCLYQNMRVFL